MYRIVAREDLAPVTKLFVVQAPEAAGKAQPGQFVIVVVGERGERVPLTIADYDRQAGTITIIFQEVGKTTRWLGTKKAGDDLCAFTGPLGLPTEIANYGTVMCVGGGVGIAPIYPIARALKEAGNKVISVIGARNKGLLFWEDRMGAVSDELVVATDDGSYGRKALVPNAEKEILEAGVHVDRIWAIGPAIMMKYASLASRPFGIKTIVSLNTIMVDGTGMCGACRVEVAGKTRFVCVDGPEFDGHEVNWDLLMDRQRIFLGEEERASVLYESQCQSCRDGGR